ncbi:MAG TPA: SRPBCC domain-containing protein [Acidimicrobiales bacterium]|nr:SRPBCC domain-containing protein [Acidimicrobiales bacterium]
MTVISTHKDAENLTLTVIAEFDSTPEQVWEVWEDPRKLEQWWGPPTFPATFIRHDFFVGGESRYLMTGPEGETPKGWWRIEAIDRPRRLDFANGLAGDDGEPVPGVEPMSAYMVLEAVGSGTRMTAVTSFVDVAQMEMLLGMGMQEGMAQAIGQIDDLLSPSRSRA